MLKEKNKSMKISLDVQSLNKYLQSRWKQMPYSTILKVFQ